jgi:hypothetical protein
MAAESASFPPHNVPERCIRLSSLVQIFTGHIRGGHRAFVNSFPHSLQAITWEGASTHAARLNMARCAEFNKSKT